jgi:hypothetical protein
MVKTVGQHNNKTLNYSELDDDFDCRENCTLCNHQVQEVGSPFCDECDPTKENVNAEYEASDIIQF